MADPSFETYEQAMALGAALMRQGERDEAAACYRRALMLKPDDATAHYNLGVVLRDQGGWTQGEAEFRHALALRPDHAEAHNNLGIVLQQQDRLEEATHCYRRALSLNPGHAKARYNLALALAHQGEIEQAATHYRHALALKPDYVRAHYNLALQGGMNGGSAEAEASFSLLMQQMATLDRFDAGNRSLLLFAAATVHAARGEDDPAFAYLIEANAIERATLSFDISATEQRLGSIPDLFPKYLFERLQNVGETSERPIFIVGMARSGTTLVEQIISAHPRVHGAGEIPAIALLAERIAGLRGSPDSPWTEALTSADCLEIGRNYLDSLPSPPGARRTTDKTLFNLEHIGLIHLCLPNAKIVFCRRDPRDTCLSCFSTRFSDGQAYAYDLVELGRYWRAYDGLMTHWRDVLPPGCIHEVDYEDLVEDVETGARRLIAHCGLDWDEACLNFHRSKRQVCTASFAQVRRPIYRGSVGRWRRFQRHLGPLLAALGEPWVSKI